MFYKNFYKISVYNRCEPREHTKGLNFVKTELLLTQIHRKGQFPMRHNKTYGGTREALMPKASFSYSASQCSYRVGGKVAS